MRSSIFVCSASTAVGHDVGFEGYLCSHKFYAGAAFGNKKARRRSAYHWHGVRYNIMPSSDVRLYVCVCALKCLLLIYADNDIDGEAFLELTESEVKALVPKLGTAKKVLRLQASMVCFYYYTLFPCSPLHMHVKREESLVI